MSSHLFPPECLQVVSSTQEIAIQLDQVCWCGIIQAHNEKRFIDNVQTKSIIAIIGYYGKACAKAGPRPPILNSSNLRRLSSTSRVCGKLRTRLSTGVLSASLMMDWRLRFSSSSHILPSTLFAVLIVWRGTTIAISVTNGLSTPHLSGLRHCHGKNYVKGFKIERKLRMSQTWKVIVYLHHPKRWVQVHSAARARTSRPETGWTHLSCIGHCPRGRIR